MALSDLLFHSFSFLGVTAGRAVWGFQQLPKHGASLLTQECYSALLERALLAVTSLTSARNSLL